MKTHWSVQTHVGIFHLDQQPIGGWRLSISAHQLGMYDDHLSGMMAVCHHDTGFKQWDRLKGQVKAPEDDQDWDSG